MRSELGAQRFHLYLFSPSLPPPQKRGMQCGDPAPLSKALPEPPQGREAGPRPSPHPFSGAGSLNSAPAPPQALLCPRCHRRGSECARGLSTSSPERPGRVLSARLPTLPDGSDQAGAGPVDRQPQSARPLWAPGTHMAKDPGWLGLGCFTVPWGILSFLMDLTGEGNGNPLQYSCLENPMDGGAW